MIASYFICWLCLIAAYAIWVVNVALWIVETVEAIGRKR